jgi:hypothetical protein
LGTFAECKITSVKTAMGISQRDAPDLEIGGQSAADQGVDPQDFGLATQFIASSTFLAGTLRKVGKDWLFWIMNGGSASPLSIDHYYFP